jgi:DNA-binding beta-propeller fold protein YncE
MVSAIVRRLAALALLAVAAPGCGSAAPRDFPRAAEPARSPPATATPAGRLLRVGSMPEGIVAGGRTGIVAVAGGRVFVGDGRGATVSVLERGRVVRRIRVALQPGGLAVLDRGRVLAVVSARERVVELFDTRTLARLGRAPAGVGPTHVVSDGRSTLYVVDTAGDGLLVFRLRPKLTLTRRYALLGAPYGVAADRSRNRLWVTLTRRNEVVELAAGARPHELARFAAPRQPDTVAVDERTGRVFVTGTAGGVLQVLDAPAD